MGKSCFWNEEYKKGQAILKWINAIPLTEKESWFSGLKREAIRCSPPADRTCIYNCHEIDTKMLFIVYYRQFLPIIFLRNKIRDKIVVK
jgi:hypothetical protein